MIIHKLSRRVLWTVWLGFAFACCAMAQETQPAAAEPSVGWAWLNFLILAFGLGYLMKKYLPPLFQKQSAGIQAAIRDAAKVKEEAAAYAAGIEARFTNIEKEIEALKVRARADMAAEGDRIQRETERHLDRIREQTAQEVELLTRSAKDELRRYSAGLAIGLAEQRIRSRMTPATQEQLAEGFLRNLSERGAQQVAN